MIINKLQHNWKNKIKNHLLETKQNYIFAARMERGTSVPFFIAINKC